MHALDARQLDVRVADGPDTNVIGRRSWRIVTATRAIASGERTDLARQRVVARLPARYGWYSRTIPAHDADGVTTSSASEKTQLNRFASTVASSW